MLMEKNNRLYLVRHGQVVDFDHSPVYGHTDIDITEVGKIQMEHLTERLRLSNIKAVFSSDLQRAVKGARIIGRYHNVPHYSLPELREMYFGDWEGMRFKDIREQYPDELDRRKDDLVNFQPPGDGESIALFAERVMAAFQNILDNQNGNEILLVAHGGVNRVILCNSLGLDLSRLFYLQQDYGCLNIIDYFPDSIVVKLVNG